MRTLTAISTGIILALTTACSSDKPATESSVAFDQLTARADSGRERPYDDLATLPVLIKDRHDDPSFTSVGGPQLAITGTIEDVTRGASFTWTLTDDGDERTQLAFGDSEAMIDTVHLTVQVTDVLAPHPEDQMDTIEVGLAFDGGINFDDARNDLLGLGDVVLFLNQTAVFDYENQLWSVVEDGGLIGTIGGSDTVSFPFLSDTSSLLEGETLDLSILQVL